MKKYHTGNSLEKIRDLVEENKVKNFKSHIHLLDRINEYRGTRFQKYNTAVRYILDYKYSTVPSTWNLSGIFKAKEYYEFNDEYESNPYCYNKNGSCKFWRKNYSNGVVYCDAYKDYSEVDNSDEAYIKALKVFKTWEKVRSLDNVIALFDAVDCCGLKVKKSK